jgi:hypothetical protein
VALLRRGSLAMPPPPINGPATLLLPTLAGALLAATELTPSELTALSELCTRMAAHSECALPLGASIAAARTRTALAQRAVDGDYAFLFMRLSIATQEQVLAGWEGWNRSRVIALLHRVGKRLL